MLERIAHAEIIELRLARPPANALNPELIAALAEAIEAAPAAGARALVLSGRPGMFSGGSTSPCSSPSIAPAWRRRCAISSA